MISHYITEMVRRRAAVIIQDICKEHVSCGPKAALNNISLQTGRMHVHENIVAHTHIRTQQNTTQ